MNALEKRFVAKLKLERSQAVKRAEGLQHVIERMRQDQKRYDGNTRKVMRSLATTVKTLAEPYFEGVVKR